MHIFWYYNFNYKNINNNEKKTQLGTISFTFYTTNIYTVPQDARSGLSSPFVILTEKKHTLLACTSVFLVTWREGREGILSTLCNDVPCAHSHLQYKQKKKKNCTEYLIRLPYISELSLSLPLCLSLFPISVCLFVCLFFLMNNAWAVICYIRNSIHSSISVATWIPSLGSVRLLLSVLPLYSFMCSIGIVLYCVRSTIHRTAIESFQANNVTCF